jgi:aminoglycoside phosphotransferase (APT) family kinase protein
MIDRSVDALVTSLRELGLVPADASPALTPLTGGVASDIWLVRYDGGAFVVKRALDKLRVAAEWRVPVSRNASEVAWFRWAGSIASDAVPRVLAHDRTLGFFTMDFLAPDSHPVWKQELQAGRADPIFAAKVGDRLGAIHAGSAGHRERAVDFNDDALFRAIRLEPYLEATALRHPQAADALHALARQTLGNRRALVHGDVSPKNILVGPKGPVFLDAECAWYGDPAFDLAFCLNHLLLKGLWRRASAPDYLACFSALKDAYLGQVRWEPAGVLEARASALLPALLLARIDGKSPVEYIEKEEVKAWLRRFAIPLIRRPTTQLSDIAARWSGALEALSDEP